MSCNIIKEYAEFNKSNLEQYTKMLMDKYYDENIFSKYIEKYTSIRYYNEEPEVRATLEYNLNHYLKKVYESNQTTISEFIFKIFTLYYYLDDVIDFDYNKHLSNLTDLMNEIKEKKVGIIDENFTKEITSLIKENKKRKEEFLNIFNTHDFYLDIKQLPDKDIYNVKLKYEIEFPKLYSKYAIRKVWETEKISEDKIKIEYYLINQLILKDIIKGIYHNNYLLDFKNTLLSKDDLLTKTLEIFNNSIAKDLITLKITYTDFSKNKEKIYSLIKEGYQFAVILDEKYITSKDNKNIIDIFKYIIINNKEYETSNLKEKKNVIVIE